MKNIVLKRIVLENWKSRNIDISFNAHITSIKGRNGIGKTSIMNAWCWLLTSFTDSVHPRNYELYDSTMELTHETPKAIVTAYIDIDGAEYKLTRTAKAGFVRKRGELEWVKASSDKYEMFIDDIEYTPTQFNEWIDHNICASHLLPFVLDGSFFSNSCEENVSKARELLLSICGEIKDDDFKGDYSLLNGLDRDASNIPHVIEIQNKKRKTIENTISKIIPNEIIRNKGFLVTVDKSEEEVNEKIKEKTDELEKINEKIKDVLDKNKNEDVEKITKQIETFTALLVTKRVEYVSKVTECQLKIDYAEDKNKEIKIENEKLNFDYCEKKKQLREIQKEKENTESYLKKLREELKEIKSRIFVAEKCSYCGQDLPYEYIEELERKFNEQKVKDLKSCSTMGKQYKSMLDSHNNTICKLEEEVSKGLNLLEYVDIDALKKEKEKLLNRVPFDETDDAVELRKKIDALNAELDEKSNQKYLQKLNEDSISIREELLGLETMKHNCTCNKIILDRLNDFEKEKKRLAVELVEIEKILNKANEWIEERASIITERINKMLSSSRIQMWSRLKNGEVSPDCLILDNNGVKYGTTNTAERIKINLDIQRMFMNYSNVVMPTFVDECSIFSSFNLPKIDSQVIYIYASDDNKIIVE